MFGMPGHYEILIIGVIILLLFGKRLPGAMRSLGRSITEFKKGIKDDSDGDEKPEATT
jgi:sec-independent protein translocase protein TatA